MNIANMRGQTLFDELLRLSALPKVQIEDTLKPLTKPLLPPFDPYIERGICIICTIQTCSSCDTTHYTQSESLFLFRTKKRGGLAEYKGLTDGEAILYEHLPRYVVYRSQAISRCTGCFEGEVIEL